MNTNTVLGKKFYNQIIQQYQQYKELIQINSNVHRQHLKMEKSSSKGKAREMGVTSKSCNLSQQS